MPAEAMPTRSSADGASSAPVIDRIVDGITTFPADFQLHPKLDRVDREAPRGAARRRRSIGRWRRLLAFGSLVLEGTPVRLSGQDSGRGTFSQRHAEYHDCETAACTRRCSIWRRTRRV